MEHYDFVCDEGFTSLRLLQRNPIDLAQPLRGFRVQIRCSDCVAGLDVDADNWQGFAELFTHDYGPHESASWTAPAGEWNIHIERDRAGNFAITSELDSLHEYHRWVLRTQFKLSAKRFRETSDDVLKFVGTWQQ